MTSDSIDELRENCTRGVTSRRRFLAGTGACVAGAAALGSQVPRLAFASPTDPNRGDAVVVIFLRGAADGLSLTPPIAAAFDSYRAIRPTIHLTPDRVRPLDSSNPNASFPQGLDGVVGLHPNLNGLFDSVWLDGKMAVMPASGMPDNESRTRSHFEAQRFAEYGTANFAVRSGWLARVIAGQAPSGVAPGVGKDGGNQAIFRGALNAFAVPRVSRFGVDGFRRRDDAFAALNGMYTGGGLINQIGNSTLDAVAAIGGVNTDSNVNYPNSSLGRHLQEVAALLRSNVGLITAIVNTGNWDHHNEQIPRFDDRSRELGDALTAFVTDLGPALDETLIYVVSEFGRTIDENGNGGTDHGRGGTSFLIGGGVRGGVYGRDYPDEIVDTRENRRALPVLTDFRQALNETLVSRVGVDGVFPTLQPAPALGVSR